MCYKSNILCDKNNSIPPQIAKDGGEAADIPSGGRTWGAPFEFTRITIEPTILPRILRRQPSP